jgi:hypothetical protein
VQYSCGVFIVFVGALTSTVISFVLRTDVDDLAKQHTSMLMTMSQQYGVDAQVTSAWDTLQSKAALAHTFT